MSLDCQAAVVFSRCDHQNNNEWWAAHCIKKGMIVRNKSKTTFSLPSPCELCGHKHTVNYSSDNWISFENGTSILAQDKWWGTCVYTFIYPLFIFNKHACLCEIREGIFIDRNLVWAIAKVLLRYRSSSWSSIWLSHQEK